jgi:hypothetical protein
MKNAVLIKQVPDTEMERHLSANGQPSGRQERATDEGPQCHHRGRTAAVRRGEALILSG